MSSYASPTYVNKDEPCAIVIRLLASLPLQMQKYGRRRSELCYSSVFVRVFCLQQHKPMHFRCVSHSLFTHGTHPCKMQTDLTYVHARVYVFACSALGQA